MANPHLSVSHNLSFELLSSLCAPPVQGDLLTHCPGWQPRACWFDPGCIRLSLLRCGVTVSVQEDRSGLLGTNITETHILQDILNLPPKVYLYVHQRLIVTMDHLSLKQLSGPSAPPLSIVPRLSWYEEASYQTWTTWSPASSHKDLTYHVCSSTRYDHMHILWSELDFLRIYLPPSVHDNQHLHDICHSHSLLNQIFGILVKMPEDWNGNRRLFQALTRALAWTGGHLSVTGMINWINWCMGRNEPILFIPVECHCL